MVVLTLTLPHPLIRWVDIAIVVLVVIYNLVALAYPGTYDNFLIVVRFVFNGLTI